MRARVVVILSDDFVFSSANHTFELRDESHFFSDLYCLSAAPRAEFVEEAARVSLDCVFADEEFVGDLAVAETLRDQLENFQLAPRDTEIFQALLVESEWLGHRDFSDDENFFLVRQLQSKPDPETGEECGDESAIDLDRVLDDEEAKLDHPQHDDQDPAAQTVDERVDERLLFHGAEKESHAKPQRRKESRKEESGALRLPLRLCVFA